MTRKIRILIVEDSEDDAMLLVYQLKKNNFETEHLIVDNKKDFTQALENQSWDLVLSDYNLPQFTGLEAFRIFRDRNLEIPFIMVSGAIGEEVAVEAMREGIHDYVMKNNPDRLVPAIERELKESKIRQEKYTAEKIIKAERQKFERLVNLSPMGLVIIQHDGTIKFVNPRIIDLFGYEKAELHTLTDLVNRIFPDRPAYQWAREYWLNTFRPDRHSNELQFPPAVCSDGAEKHVSFRSGLIDDESYFLLLEDVTIQRLAMRALEENQKRLWQIIQSVDDIIIEVKITGNGLYHIISVNDAFTRCTGMIKEEVINQSLDAVVPAGHRIFDLIGRSIRNRSPEKIEDTLDINSKLLTWDMGIAPVFNESGQLLRIILSAHDITERKKSELKLLESENRFRLIASLASDAIWEWHVRDDSVWWNEGIQTLFNYDPAGIDHSFRWLEMNIHPDDREKFSSMVEVAVSDKKESLNTDFRFKCADETYKVVNCKLNLFFDTDGKAERALGAMIDLTQRKKTEELRIQSLVEGADNERAGIARELHDSLSQNLTLASIMLQGILEKQHDAEVSDKIREAERIVSRVLNDTRDISHNLMPKTLNDFGLKSAVENLVEHLSHGVGFRVNFYCNLDDQRFPRAVEMNIFRIIQESFNNIIKHASASQVHVSLTKNDEMLTLMLEDNGKGFDAGDPGLKPGVGLQNIENRTIYLNGKLTVESKKEKGTLIMVDVPV